MIRLSYSMCNEIIKTPHAYLNRVGGLKKKTSPAMEKGKQIHRIIQDSLCGDTPHPLFADVPTFEIVEKIDLDPATKIEFQHNDKYSVIGYADGLNQSRTAVVEIKSGAKTWSISDFNKLAQWKIYKLGIPTLEQAFFITVPQDISGWNRTNIKFFKLQITDKHQQEARDFLDQAIHVIENIKDYVEKEQIGKFNRCFYQECPWGCDSDETIQST